MAVKTIAFLYNVRHKYPDPQDPRTQLEVDFDDPITTKWQIRHLRNCGFKVLPIEANDKAYFKLFRNKKKIDLVLNVAEGMYGSDRESHLPAMLEMLQIPYTGCTPLSQALVLSKSKTKEVLMANNVPTLPFQVFKSHQEELNKSLNYPLIVKPEAEGSGAGISNKSVVKTKSDLRGQVKLLLRTFANRPVLVEPFLEGQEYSVAMIGNPPKILPIIAPDYSKLPANLIPMDSFEVKWIFEEQAGNSNYLRCPADIGQNLRNKIERICMETWKALNIVDWCRIDLRSDNKGKIYVLEVNTPPGIIPPEVSTTSYFPLAARAGGIDYEEMLKKIINFAIKRYN